MSVAISTVARPAAPVLTFSGQTEPLRWRSVPTRRTLPEQNRLLAALPADEYQRLAPYLEVVHLEAKQVLASPEQSICHVYFPRDAVISLLVPMEDGSAAEGATIGNEGMVGLQVFLGDSTASEEVVAAVPGAAVRMRASIFKALVQQTPQLQTVLHRYTLALMNQMARTAGCNRVHPVDQRCARLLLMSRDRVGRDTFPMTHEFLATMLAVRRASVTEAAGLLQQAGCIEYRRGQVTIRDPQALEDAACEDYRLALEAYDRAYERPRSSCSI
jgi:CRP-like cAMP-binding protein